MPRRFRSSVSGDAQTAFNDVFEAGGEIDGTALDLDAISKAPLGTICMDLMMYMQPELFEASMSLLKSCYTQRKSIITAMDRVQVRVRTNANVVCRGRRRRRSTGRTRVLYFRSSAAVFHRAALGPRSRFTPVGTRPTTHGACVPNRDAV